MCHNFILYLCLAVTLLTEVTSMFKEKLLAIWEKLIDVDAGLNYWKGVALSIQHWQLLQKIFWQLLESEAYVEHIFR